MHCFLIRLRVVEHFILAAFVKRSHQVLQPVSWKKKIGPFEQTELTRSAINIQSGMRKWLYCWEIPVFYEANNPLWNSRVPEFALRILRTYLAKGPAAMADLYDRLIW